MPKIEKAEPLVGGPPVALSALIATAHALMAKGKGLLAMDESVSTCNRRFAEFGIAQTWESRRRYRDLLVTTPGLSDAISGAILFDETLQQRTDAGTPIVEVLRLAGIMVGIKVDAGAQPLAAHPGERITEGLDGLRERLQQYAAAGVRFAKWRAMLILGDGLPSSSAIASNAHALARYAALCQEAGLVPIVEPEVVMDQGQSLARCGAVTAEVLQRVFEELYRQRVSLEAMLLKPNMVLPSLTCATAPSLTAVADATLDVLLRTVPAAVAGIAFLSGGQPDKLATARLNAMHQRAGTRVNASGPLRTDLPWPLTFSFGRALQQPTLKIWAGDDANRAAAQQALLHRARMNGAAACGAYHDGMEAQDSLP